MSILKSSEIGTIRKEWAGRIRIALIYPNRYSIGMSNLGFQTVYRLFNQFDSVVCERAFLPEDGSRSILSIESRQPLSAFDIIAFSISFENDYIHILTILDNAGIPFDSAQRSRSFPLVIAGGVACFLNPEPISRFIDFFLIGEAEAMLPRFFSALVSFGLSDSFNSLVFESDDAKQHTLLELAKHVPGIYVPSAYQVRYHSDGTIKEIVPTCDVPNKIHRQYLSDVDQNVTTTSILTSDTAFKDNFLIEVGRGCPYGCRFCSAGFVYRPPRFCAISNIENSMDAGVEFTSKIGLVGAAILDHPNIDDICNSARSKNIQLTYSSFRADKLTTSRVEALSTSGLKTATIAPDGGSERMRRIINKGITETHILNATEMLVASGILNLKVYFMIGLPHETDKDIDELIALCMKIKQTFLESSRSQKRIGTIKISLNPFVPKPFTPFQWAAMETGKAIKRKVKQIQKALNPIPNITFQMESYRESRVQGLLSRGDRRVSDALIMAFENNGNWTKTLNETPIDPDFYVHRERSHDEIFPWSLIDHGIDETFLRAEYEKAGQEKTSPRCPMDSACERCGVCAGKLSGMLM